MFFIKPSFLLYNFPLSLTHMHNAQAHAHTHINIHSKSVRDLGTVLPK